MTSVLNKLCYGALRGIRSARSFSKLYTEEEVADVTGQWVFKPEIESVLEAIVTEKQMAKNKAELFCYPLHFLVGNQEYNKISCIYCSGAYFLEEEGDCVIHSDSIVIKYIEDKRENNVYYSGERFISNNEKRVPLSTNDKYWLEDLDRYITILDNPEDVIVRTWIVENCDRV